MRGEREGRFEDCADCAGKEELKERRGVEVGHTFLLGERYSAPLRATVTTPEGGQVPAQMGCYGLGVSRILGAAAEALSTERELRWPRATAPFRVCVLAPKPGSREEVEGGGALSREIYDVLNDEVFPEDASLDDRQGS